MLGPGLDYWLCVSAVQRIGDIPLPVIDFLTVKVKVICDNLHYEIIVQEDHVVR